MNVNLSTNNKGNAIFLFIIQDKSFYMSLFNSMRICNLNNCLLQLTVNANKFKVDLKVVGGGGLIVKLGNHTKKF